MRKFLLSILVTTGLLSTSCQKSNFEQNGDGSEVSVTIEADMESANTRAIANYGNGSEVNRAILEVYNGEELYKRMVAPVDGGDTKTVQFELRLVSNRTYNFVVWADKASGDDDVATSESFTSTDPTDRDLYYETNDGLTAITIKEDVEYRGSEDGRDAFTGRETKEVAGATSVAMTLYRPFGQLNVQTKLTGVAEANLPKTVKVVYKDATPVAHTFNALTQETSNYKALSWANAVEIIDIDDVNTNNSELLHVSTDYLFAPKSGQSLVDFTMSFYNESGSLIIENDNFKNIPIQRNYRTNISGELLSDATDIDIENQP